MANPMKPIRPWPRTDFGTVLLHWPLAASLVWLSLTGLRIASDDEEFAWLRNLDRILPSRQLWLNHVIAAEVMTGVVVAYVVYIFLARLTSRVKIDRTRLAGLTGTPRARWASINVLICWGLFVSLATSIVTGWLCFVEFDNTVLLLHMYAALVLVLLPVLHVLVHVRIGGLRQLARIVRPSALAIPEEESDLAEIVAQLLAEQKSSELKFRQARTKSPKRAHHA